MEVTLWLVKFVGLALVFVAVSLAIMVAICRFRLARAVNRLAARLDGNLSFRLLVLRGVAIGTGVLAAGMLFLLGPFGTRISILWVHRTALGALLGFLWLAQYQQVKALVLCRRGAPIISIASCYLRLWRLTEIAPAPVALVLAASGIQLAAGGYSLEAGWLCALVLAFGFLFFDGILGFTPLSRQLKREALLAVETGEEIKLRELVRSVSVNGTLTSHFASFPLFFLFGWFKPPLANPLAREIHAIEGWGGVQTAALAVIALSGLIVAGARWCSRSWTSRRTTRGWSSVP